MANRMEIELTSARDDDTYTWRAAGARQPKGIVPVSVLPPHSKVGDVLRVEVEVEIDGITVLSVLPPKEKAAETNRIEYIGPPRPEPGVTTLLAGKSGRGAGRDGDRERRGRRPERDREGRSSDRRTGTAGRESTRRGPSTTGRRPAGAGEAGSSRPRDEARSSGPRREAAQRAETGTGGPGRQPTGTRPARRPPSRFEPATAHRDELFATLSPEQRAIAERLAIGGLPAVRKALTEEQQRARTEGRPVASGEPIIAIAEQLLGDVKAAVWLDRAEAAVAKLDEITLRDLRSTVVGAAPRDEAGRDLERQLREALDKRVAKLRKDWEDHLEQAIGDGRVLQALRLSAKPPEPSARFPGTLVRRLADLAGQAMSEETTPERWLSLLEAAVQSPVRRQIQPAGIPKDSTGEVAKQARAASSRIPGFARLLGMAIPPPPKPVQGEHPARPAGPGRPARPARPKVRSSAPPGVVQPEGAPATQPAGEQLAADASATLLEPASAGEPAVAEEERSAEKKPAEAALLDAAPGEVPQRDDSAIGEIATPDAKGPDAVADRPEEPPASVGTTEQSEDPVVGEEVTETADER